MSGLNNDRHVLYVGIVDHALSVRQINEAQLAAMSNADARSLAHEIAAQALPAYNVPWPQLREGVKHNLITRVYKSRSQRIYPR